MWGEITLGRVLARYRPTAGQQLGQISDSEPQGATTTNEQGFGPGATPTCESSPAPCSQTCPSTGRTGTASRAPSARPVRDTDSGTAHVKKKDLPRVTAIAESTAASTHNALHEPPKLVAPTLIP